MLHRTNGPMRARMCCGEANKTLGRTISGAQYKREHVLPRFLAQFPARKWYVITEEDVWWSGPRLLALLSAADRAVAKEAAKRGVEPSQVPALVSGGPDGSIDGPFLIVNRLLLAQLAGAEPGASSSPRTRGLSHCRHALLRCITSRSFRKKNQRMTDSFYDLDTHEIVEQLYGEIGHVAGEQNIVWYSPDVIEEDEL